MTLLLNPRTQDWFEHFALGDGWVRGLTAEGRTTVCVLATNAVQRRALRQDSG